MQNLPEFEKIKNYLDTLQDELEDLKREEQIAAEQAGRSKEALDDMIRLMDCGEKRRKTDLKIKALIKYTDHIEALQNDLYCNRESHNDFTLAILSFFKFQSTTKLLIEDFVCKAEQLQKNETFSQKT